MNSHNEEATYNTIIETLDRAQNYILLYQPHHSAVLNYMRNEVMGHHMNCIRAAQSVKYILASCVIYLALGIVCGVSKDPSDRNLFAVIPCGIMIVWIIAKILDLKSYVDLLKMKLAVFESIISGIWLFYAAVIWNNVGTAFAALTWLINGFSIVMVIAPSCAMRAGIR